MRGHRRSAIATGALAALLAAPLMVAAPLVLASGSASAAAVSPAAVASKHGQERFHLTSRVATATTQRAQATGVLSGNGHADLGEMKSGRQTVWLVFSHGSVRMATSITSRWASVPNPSTCKFTEVYRGDYRLKGGNRRYADAAGSGTYVTTTISVLKRKNGNCSSQLTWFWQSTKTTGSMSW